MSEYSGSDQSSPYAPQTTTKGPTQNALDMSQVAFSAAPNYQGTPTEYYDKNGQLIGYLANGNNVMSTSGLSFVNPDGTPNTGAINKHSLFQATDENGNLLFNPAAQTQAGEAPVYATQDQGAGAVTQQLAGQMKMNAPSPGILQDPLFKNFMLSAGAMGAGAALAPAAGASGLPAGMTGADLANMGLTAEDLTAMGVTPAELGSAGLPAAGALSGADLLKYGKMGLSGLSALSSLSKLAGTQGQPGQGGLSSGGGGATNVYNSSGPWNTPLKPELATIGQASQRPITSGLENLKTLEPSIDQNFGKPQAESSIPQQSYFTYGSPVQTTYPTSVPPAYKNGGGVLQKFRDGGQPHVPEFITGTTGHYVKGRGDGQSDDIPAMLADGEYVFDSSTVSTLGNGSSDAGAKLLDAFRESLRDHTRSAPSDKIPPKASPLEYMKNALKKVGAK